MADGEDPLSEEQKEKITKVAKFDALTSGFWSPELAAQYRETKEKEAAGENEESKDVTGTAEDKTGDENAGGRGSALNSTKDKAAAEEAEEEEGPEYDPMIPEQWLDRCREFSELNIMKFARIWQSVIYLTKYKERADICEFDTNKLSWKKVRAMMNVRSEEDGIKCIFQCIGEYRPFGPKDDEFKEYQKLKFIKENLDAYQPEEVEQYSLALGKLFNWIQEAIGFRIDDVLSRRAGKVQEREVRQEALEREEERQQKRTEALDEAKAIWEEAQEAAAEGNQEEEEPAEKVEIDDEGEKKPAEFDMEDFDAKFDDENPPEAVPAEVVEDIDNDFNVDIKLDDDEEE